MVCVTRQLHKSQAQELRRIMVRFIATASKLRLAVPLHVTESYAMLPASL